MSEEEETGGKICVLRLCQKDHRGPQVSIPGDCMYVYSYISTEYSFYCTMDNFVPKVFVREQFDSNKEFLTD